MKAGTPQFYAFEKGQKIGPLSAEEVQIKWESKELNLDSPLHDGIGWKTVMDVVRDLPPRPKVVQPPPVPAAPLPVASPSPGQRKTNNLLIAAGVSVVLIFWFLTQLFSGHDSSVALTPEEDAYYSARNYVEREIPSVKKVYPRQESVVEHEGDIFRVVLKVDGVNAFNAPIRKFLALEMKRSGESWTVLKVVQN